MLKSGRYLDVFRPDRAIDVIQDYNFNQVQYPKLKCYIFI